MQQTMPSTPSSPARVQVAHLHMMLSGHLVALCGSYGYWSIALLFYAVKFVYPPLNEITSYGKFQTSTSRSLVYPISNKHAWITFYAVGWCWNALLIYLASGNMQALSKSYLAHFFIHFPPHAVTVPLQFNIMMQVIKYLTQASKMKSHII
jgi:hypothetical protein